MIQADRGYSIFEEVFARAEMAEVTETLSANLPQRTKAGEPVVRQCAWLPMVPQAAILLILVLIARTLDVDDHFLWGEAFGRA